MVTRLTLAMFALALTGLVHAAEPDRWGIDAQNSTLGFVAEQAGAKFSGRFEVFDADVRFDPQQLAQSSASVTIEMSSVTTYEDERDGIVKGTGWFEVGRFPQAKFEARDFRLAGGGFIADGTLRLLDAVHPVRFEFTVVADGNGRRLEGRAQLDRIVLGLGLGEWEDPAWIGRNVQVNVVLVTSP